MRAGTKTGHGQEATMWEDIYAWIAYLAAPLFLLGVIVYVFRPSAREKYRRAKRIPFENGGRHGDSSH